MVHNSAPPKSVIVSALHRLWRRLSNELYQYAPEAIALCEFDCRKAQCSGAEWASCERRLKEAAEGLAPGRNRA